MVLAFVLVFNLKAFAQIAVENNSISSTVIIANTFVELSSTKQEVAFNAPDMNFVLWFMGSKQDPNAKVLTVGENTKK